MFHPFERPGLGDSDGEGEGVEMPGLMEEEKLDESDVDLPDACPDPDMTDPDMPGHDGKTDEESDVDLPPAVEDKCCSKDCMGKTREEQIDVW